MSHQTHCATCQAVIPITARGLGVILCLKCEDLWYNSKFTELVLALRQRNSEQNQTEGESSD